MNTIKIKDFCNRYQHEMQKSRDKDGIEPIISLRAGWRRDTFQTQNPMWNCSWIRWKYKIISAMNISRKGRIKEGIIPLKSFQAGWRRETFQTKYPMWTCSWLPWIWKIIFVMDTNMKCKKAGMEEGIMPIKSFHVIFCTSKRFVQANNDGYIIDSILACF